MSILKFTLDEVRQRELALVGTQGPTTSTSTPWWSLADPSTNDCVGAQLFCLGVRGRSDYAPHYISIAAFRAWAGWDEPSLNDLTAGDLVVENWSNPIGTEPEHMEYVYSIDRGASKITTIAANTGPKPGFPLPRGMWKKTRTLDGHFLFGIRPPYKEATASKSRKTDVKLVAGYLNQDSIWPPTVTMAKTAAVTDGIEGPVYWTLVQQWGRAHNLYGPTFHIDGIPGPRSRVVEAAILKLAKRK